MKNKLIEYKITIAYKVKGKNANDALKNLEYALGKEAIKVKVEFYKEDDVYCKCGGVKMDESDFCKDCI